MTTTWNKDLTPGATLEGIYIKKESVASKFDEGKYVEKYIIKTPEGEMMGVFSSATLANQFKNVPEGSYVWITFKGKETSKTGRSVNVYEVEYDDEV